MKRKRYTPARKGDTHSTRFMKASPTPRCPYCQEQQGWGGATGKTFGKGDTDLLDRKMMSKMAQVLFAADYT